ncbi:MAG: tetratricopeptide repeat protein [Candidatus Acidiferrales bacterium]
MKISYRYPVIVLLALAVVLVSVFAQKAAYTPGEFQSSNPNYPKPNPFYFEGKIDWNLLGITQPQNAWDFLQRGLHFQDDMNDIPDAINDYQTSLSMNSLQNNTCQIVTSATLVNGVIPTQLTPAPCMFTVRLRLGFLLRETNPGTSIQLYQEVLQIDPQRIGVNTLIAETYVIEAEQTADPTTKQQAYANAVAAYQSELAISPVTPQSTALTADLANNSKVHWELAQVYIATGQNTLAKSELNSYLQATKWHSDVYPWRIALAQNLILTLP